MFYLHLDQAFLWPELERGGMKNWKGIDSLVFDWQLLGRLALGRAKLAKSLVNWKRASDMAIHSWINDG